MAGVWLPFKELANIVTSAILHKQSDSYYTLEATLKKHKPDFISLLQNPVRKELEGGSEGEMERGEMMRRERERLEGDKKRQGWEKGEEGYAHVQLPEVSFEGSS